MSECSENLESSSPVTASHTRTVLSGLQDTSCSPSGVQCSSSTAFLWPAGVGDGR